MTSLKSILIQPVILVGQTLSEQKWGWQKIGMIILIFTLPLGPLALAVYLFGKYFNNRRQNDEQ